MCKCDCNRFPFVVDTLLWDNRSCECHTWYGTCIQSAEVAAACSALCRSISCNPADVAAQMAAWRCHKKICKQLTSAAASSTGPAAAAQATQGSTSSCRTRTGGTSVGSSSSSPASAGAAVAAAPTATAGTIVLLRHVMSRSSPQTPDAVNGSSPLSVGAVAKTAAVQHPASSCFFCCVLQCLAGLCVLLQGLLRWLHPAAWPEARMPPKDQAHALSQRCGSIAPRKLSTAALLHRTTAHCVFFVQAMRCCPMICRGEGGSYRSRW